MSIETKNHIVIVTKTPKNFYLQVFRKLSKGLIFERDFYASEYQQTINELKVA